MHGDAVPLFFYSDLFLRHPEVRDLFPVSMTVQRDRFLHALATIVSQVDNLDGLRDYLRGLGRDHRKFGALAGHFPAVRISLLATLAHFSEEAWTPELSQDWKAAYDAVAEIMIAAAQEDAAQHPAFWEATVVAHELRRFDIATFRVVTSEPLAYLPGQSVTHGVRGPPPDLAAVLDGQRAAGRPDDRLPRAHGRRRRAQHGAHPGPGGRLAAADRGAAGDLHVRRPVPDGTSCWSPGAPAWRRSRPSWTRSPRWTTRRRCTCSSAHAPRTASTT